MNIKWNASPKDSGLIGKICERAERLAHDKGLSRPDRMEMVMDLTAAHLNGCPLDLDGLLSAPDLDFAHDVFGIRRNMDRQTGALLNHFLPRCARPERAAVVNYRAEECACSDSDPGL